LPEEACFLKNVHLFDHFEFGISSKDALTMGVATRKLVEHAFLALLDSGINSRSQNVGAYTSGIAFDLLSSADAVSRCVCFLNPHRTFFNRTSLMFGMGLEEVRRLSPIEFRTSWICSGHPFPSTLRAVPR
jgi:acyl transferase domain-containing protein